MKSTIETIELTEEELKAIARAGTLTWFDALNNYKHLQALHPRLYELIQRSEIWRVELTRRYYV